ncbi:hypothetical protein U737_07465 [Methylomonas sp. LW13]|uniref:hypothetical protein n=1 Tax=unclassified Methylomonas TaxID=2608980 RepID=UPI00101FC181|nr:hypothetical protein [Methylomonas sp. LW13]QBC26760.1 hypothetical protein U737_07465 [Methylomonas sp. LW13]
MFVKFIFKPFQKPKPKNKPANQQPQTRRTKPTASPPKLKSQSSEEPLILITQHPRVKKLFLFAQTFFSLLDKHASQARRDLGKTILL